MKTDDQEFLNQIEQNIRSKENEQVDAHKEAEQRALEMERIRNSSLSQVLPGKKPAAVHNSEKVNELEADPRYKEYFERIKRQKGITPSGGTESISSVTPAGGVARVAVPEPIRVGPGSIVRFDDGSIGIYKDAVSGRDYALFYFLHPDGQFVPEGVFLQCYQAQAIGTLPESYFEKLRNESLWNRDVIVFHLSTFDHVSFLDSLAEHKERKPGNTATPARNAVVTPSQVKPTTPQVSLDARAAATPRVAPPQSFAPSFGTSDSKAESSSASEIVPQYGPRNQETPKPAGIYGLSRGQKFTIKFGGKTWEAVYWTTDSDGTIVAHSTHGHWSLMRLELDRFKDSLEPGQVVDAATMTSIAHDAAKAK